MYAVLFVVVLFGSCFSAEKLMPRIVNSVSRRIRMTKADLFGNIAVTIERTLNKSEWVNFREYAVLQGHVYGVHLAVTVYNYIDHAELHMGLRLFGKCMEFQLVAINGKYKFVSNIW